MTRMALEYSRFSKCPAIVSEAFANSANSSGSGSESVNLPLKAFANKAGAAAGDIDEFANKVRVNTRGEVVEVQVDIFNRRSELCGVVVAQVGRVQVVEVGARHDERATSLRHLLPVDGQETMGIHTCGHAEPGALQHGRPEQGMKVHDVLADEVEHLGVVTGSPVVVEIEIGAAFAEMSETRRVADWCVQPDVEVLVLGTRNTEPEVGRHHVRCPSRAVPLRTTPRAWRSTFLSSVASCRFQSRRRCSYSLSLKK